MPSSFVYTRRVEFADTDMAGIMHFSSLFRFMESAEHAFIRSLGYSVTLNEIDPALGLPRVRAEADFRRPFRFEDEIEITLTVREKRARSLTYAFELRRVGDPERHIGATGAITVVCVRRDENGNMRAHPLPSELVDRMEEAPQQRAREDN